MAHFALVVDNPQRDLKGLVLVACELVSHGHKCSLVPMGLTQELFALMPDVAVLNYARTHSAELIDRLHASGISIAVLDTEGGVFASLDHVHRTFPKDPSTRAKIARYFCWGTAFANSIVEHGFYKPEQVIVTGSPRFDYYAEPWRNAAKQLAPHRFEQPMVLINGTFPLANPRFQSRESELNQLVDHFGYEAKTVTMWQELQDASLAGMISLTKDLANKFAKVQFVYRPHPFEGLEIYRRSFKGVPNVMLGNEGTVDGWILQAQAVIHRNCSTAIEAGFCRIPALLPKWIPVSAEVPSSSAASQHFHSFHELLAGLGTILDGRYGYPTAIEGELERVTQHWFTAIDGLAYSRVSKGLMQVASGNGDGGDTYGTGGNGKLHSPNYPLGTVAALATLPLRWVARRVDPRAGLKRYRKSAKRFSVSEVLAIATHLRAVAPSRLKAPEIRHAKPRCDIHEIGCTCETIVVAPRHT